MIWLRIYATLLSKKKLYEKRKETIERVFANAKEKYGINIVLNLLFKSKNIGFFLYTNLAAKKNNGI